MGFGLLVGQKKTIWFDLVLFHFTLFWEIISRLLDNENNLWLQPSLKLVFSSSLFSIRRELYVLLPEADILTEKKKKLLKLCRVLHQQQQEQEEEEVVAGLSPMRFEAATLFSSSRVIQTCRCSAPRCSAVKVSALVFTTQPVDTTKEMTILYTILWLKRTGWPGAMPQRRKRKQGDLSALALRWINGRRGSWD